jgi:FkbM family methyltransferase
MLTILYGTQDVHIDVTATVLETCMNSSVVYIPPDDNVRGKLFTDPLFGTVKQIYINDVPYCAQTPIFIDTLDNTVYTRTIPAKIREVYPEESTLAILRGIHANLVLRHGNMNEEFPEQKMAVRFLDASSKVLEIGGNVGRNSLILASITDQSSLVTLESDPNIARFLEENRDANQMTFHIEPSALSLRPLIQKGWDTIVSDVVLDGYKKINTITLDELRAKYQIPFNTLVLDCEGAFYYILQDMPSILDGIQTIVMENDYYTVSHKEYIDETLRSKGFTCVYSETLGPEYDYKRFPFQKNFFEVWKGLNTHPA